MNKIIYDDDILHYYGFVFLLNKFNYIQTDTDFFLQIISAI